MILILDSNSMQEILFYGRVIFDLSFFFLVIIIIIQNLVFGVIIDREKHMIKNTVEPL